MRAKKLVFGLPSVFGMDCFDNLHSFQLTMRYTNTNSQNRQLDHQQAATVRRRPRRDAEIGVDNTKPTIAITASKTPETQKRCKFMHRGRTNETNKIQYNLQTHAAAFLFFLL